MVVTRKGILLIRIATMLGLILPAILLAGHPCWGQDPAGPAGIPEEDLHSVPPSPRRSSLLEAFGIGVLPQLSSTPLGFDLEVSAGMANGSAGFQFNNRLSRLDFPVHGAVVSLKSLWRFPRPGSATDRFPGAVAPLRAGTLRHGTFLFFDLSLMPSIRGTTEDTDWYGDQKWLYSRSDTEGFSYSGMAGAGYEVDPGGPLSGDLRLSLYYQRDYYRMSDLRQHCLIPNLTSPPIPEFQYIEGRVATYELQIFGLLRYDLSVHARLAPFLRVRGSFGHFILGVIEGMGDWALRKYKFWQTAFTVFDSYELRLDLDLHITPWARLTAGIYRMSFYAAYGNEEGEFEDYPQDNYYAVGVVDWIGHLRYGFHFSAMIRF
ncbi:MAG: hypothetical protein ACYTHM_03290 [Planctomycetota bacterium]